MDHITSVEQILKPGAAFPPPGQKRASKRQKPLRLDQMATNQQLYNGNHDLVYDDWAKVLRPDLMTMVEIVINYHRRLTRLWNTLLLTEPPTFKVNKEAEAWMETKITESKLMQAIGACNTDFSRYGAGLFKVTKAEGKPSSIKAQPPFIGEDGVVAGGWFPIVDPMDRQEVVAHVIAFMEVRMETMFGIPTQRRYLHAEIHEDGQITYQLWRMDGNNLKTMVEEVVTPHTGGLLLVPVINGLTTDNPYGTDDYQDIDPIVHEIEMRLSQASKILDQHADPNLQGPYHMMGGPTPGQAAATQQSQAKASRQAGRVEAQGPTVKVGGRFFGLNPDDPEVRYVTWDPNTAMVEWEIKTLIEMLHLIGETSPAAFGHIEGGTVESGAALKRLLMAPLLKVAGIRNALDLGLTEALKAAAALDGVNLTDIEIEWKDGLPQDRTEDANVETVMVGAELRSREAAIQTVYGLEGESLKDEMKRIDADREAKKAAAPTVPDPDKLNLPPNPKPKEEDGTQPPTQ